MTRDECKTSVYRQCKALGTDVDADGEPCPGARFQTDDDASRRNAVCSDGSFARREFWVVASDYVDGTSDFNDAAKLLEHMNGDTLFGESSFGRLPSSELKSSLDAAVNSAKGFMTRYCDGRHPWRDRNNLRYNSHIKYTHGWRTSDIDNVTVLPSAGGYVPVRVKVIALPPSDELADSCSSYTEYEMKCRLKGVKPSMGEKEFTIYKY